MRYLTNFEPNEKRLAHYKAIMDKYGDKVFICSRPMPWEGDTEYNYDLAAHYGYYSFGVYSDDEDFINEVWTEIVGKSDVIPYQGEFD